MKRRLLFFDITGRGGGSNVSLKLLLSHLDPDRFEHVVVVGTRPDPEIWKGHTVVTCSSASLDNYDFFPAAWTPQWIYHFLRWVCRFPFDFLHAVFVIRNANPDLIHINVGQAITFGLAARVTHCRVVWHIRELVARNWLGSLQQRVYAAVADHIIANSKATAARLPRCAGKVTVEPNFVPVMSGSAERGKQFRSHLAIPPERFVVLLLGSPSASKGYLFLADVMDRLTDLNIVAVLAGEFADPPVQGVHRLLRGIYRGFTGGLGEKARIQVRWKTLVAAGKAVCPGRVQADSAIDACNILVCPNTVGESFGRTVIEANAMGKPAVASTVEPFSEIIEDGKTGWLCDLAAESWADRIRDLYENPHIVQRAGTESQKRAAAFGANEHANRIMDLYAKILA